MVRRDSQSRRSEPEGCDERAARRVALECDYSIDRSEVFVLLHDSDASGSLVEFGIALCPASPSGMNSTTVFVGDETKMIFSALADEIFKTDEEFLQWVKSI